MSEISREEFNQKIDQVFQGINKNHEAMNTIVTQICVDVAIVKTKVEAIKIPALPDRPCEDFKEHILEHKDNIDSWKKPIIVGIILLTITFITKVVPEIILLLQGHN